MILQKQDVPLLVSLRKIWDRSPHNALTDLIRFKETWFCAFRESDAHVHGRDGQIRILASQDTVEWLPVGLFFEKGVDLRDPKLSITPDGRLMLLAGGTMYSVDDEYISRQPRAAFSFDGREWSSLTPILDRHEWLWRLTWHKGKAYGASYRFSNTGNPRQEWLISLYESGNGVDYNKITDWDIPGKPNETTLNFTKNSDLIALVRRDGDRDSYAWIGKSKAPYKDWEWQESKHYFGGPNFIILPSDSMWAAGRIVTNTPYGRFRKTILGRMTLNDIKPLLILPSGGDTSYPGLVYHQGFLWISYYSSHEANTAVYLAKVQLPYN